MIDVNGKIYSYSYYTGNDGGSPGYLLKEVQPLVGPGWKYFYDFDGVHPEGELISVTYPSGGVVEYQYGTFELTVKGNDNQTQQFKLRAITSRTSSGPNITPGTWTYFYNPSSSQDGTTITDACGNKEVYKFYGLRENSYAGNWAIGLFDEKQIRDGNDNIFQSESNNWIPYQISVDLGIPEEGYFVPLLGSKTVTRDGNSYVTNFLYNTFYGSPTRIEESGELARTTDITYYENLTGGNYIIDKPLVTTVTIGTDTKTVANSYDSLGNLILENTYDVTTEFSYHPDGNLAWEKNSRGFFSHFDQYNYGVAGRVRYGSPNIAGDSSVYTETKTINWEGTVASLTNGRGHQTLFSYDELNRLIGVTPPPSGEAQNLITYDNTTGRGFIIKKGMSEVRYDLDGLGRPIGTFSSAGVLTETGYDQCGRKVYQSLPSAFDGSTPNKGESFTYDALGRVTNITHPDGTSINYSYSGNTVEIRNERNLNKTLSFKSFGDPEDKRLVGISDALNNITSYEYDIFGNVARIDSPQGGDRIFTYNSKNFLVSESHPENGTSVYTYDEVGNVTSKTDAKNQKIQYQYDPLNRLTFIDHPLGEDDVIYAYDNANNRTLMESNSGSYSYSYAYDESNRLTRQDVSLGGITYGVNFVYDERNNLVQAAYPSGETVNYNYDAANRVIDIYDAANNLFAGLFTYHPSGAPTSYANSFGVVSDFTYDSHHRLNTLKISRTFPFLIIEKDGLGSGTVKSVSPGINCGNDCTEKYLAENIQVTLTTEPDPDSNFVGWGGDPDCIDGILVMDGVKTCIATFALKPVQNALTVNKGGTGGGVVSSSPPGIDCGNDCTENYDFNAQVTLTAAPDSGSEFAGWTGDTDCSDGVVTMDTAKTCTATFDLIHVVQHTLTAQKTGNGTGTVTSNPAGIDCGSDCAESYDENSQVTLNPIPNPDSTFTGWTGDADCSDGVVTMNSSKTCTATFTHSTGQQFTLTVNKTGSGFGTVTSSPAGINCGSDCTENFNENTQVILTATADAGSRLWGWGGDTDCSDGIVTMDANKACTAHFVKRATITVEKTGSGSGTIYSYFGTTGNQINCGNVCSSEYDFEDTIVFQEIPDSGSQFTGWETCTDLNDYDGFIIAGDRTCIARFDLLPPQHTLTVNKQGDGFGTVTSSPNGINCGSDCTQSYYENTQIALTATPSSGSSFTGWSGDPDCTDGTITMDVDKSCTATFALSTGQLTLTMSKAGTGTGTVTSNQGGIDCGSDCDESYAANTVIVLSAVPDAGSGFRYWSGDADCTDGAVFMDSNKNCTATFDLQNPKVTLTVTKSGPGTVTSNPLGISCGSDCTEDYSRYKQVTLTAKPDTGASFIGWSGHSDCIDGLVTMDTNKTCTANFSITSKGDKPTLTVTKSGIDGGVVTSNPPGINCGSDCIEVYNKNTEVTLIVTAHPGTSSMVWVTGTGCSSGFVKLDQSRTCIVNFEKITTQFGLTVNKSGTGAGTITSSPTGINCGSDCGQSYDRNTLVALTATPNAGSVFSGWSGDPDCIDSVVNMDAHKTCTANFTLSGAHFLTISKSGSGTGTVTSSPAGINCGSDCSEYYFDSAQITLNPIPDPGSSFTGWSGDVDCEDGSITMDTNKSCTANFLRTSGRFNLTVSLSGNGTGTVMSDPIGIDCGSDCTEDFVENTQVTLIPVISSDSTSVFMGWSGESDCMDGSVNMDSDVTCFARFERGCNCDDPNAILGTDGDDSISGTSGNDIICGLGGNDTLVGRGGVDCIAGGAGNDIIKGGGGEDMLYGNDGDDTIQGENGELDVLVGGPGTDNLNGGTGNNDHCFDGEMFTGCEFIQNFSANSSSLNSNTFLAGKFLIGTDLKQPSKTKFWDLLSSKLSKKKSRLPDVPEQTSAGQTATSSSLYSRVASYAKSLKVLAVSLLFTTGAYAQTAIPPTPFIDMEYSYDGASNVTTILNHINPQNNHTMQYDSLDRLSGASGSWGPGSFNYDAIGNRLNKSIDTTSENYSYGSVNNLLDGYSHDVNGNILDDHSFTYEYDSENRLVRVLSNGNVIVEYVYDGDGRRISKSAYGETTYYAYGTGLNVLTEFNVQGTPKHDYIYAGNKNIARVNFDGGGVKQNTSFYHTDHLGSSLAMTDESTTVVWGQTYLPFGDAYKGVGTQNNSHQYTGKEFDQDTGLYYYGARYYHVGLGRFMSVDPAPGVLTDSQSWNRYAYVLNNPYKYVDPDGAMSCSVMPEGGETSPDLTCGAIGGGGGSLNLGSKLNLGRPFRLALPSGPKRLALPKSGNMSKQIPEGIETPYGIAKQSNTPEALSLRQQVKNGTQLFRAGNFSKSMACEAQFFSLNNPLTTPDFANRVGAATLGKGTPDFVIGGRLKPGSPFITRPAPRVGNNEGGDLEVVTPSGSIQIDFFHMPDN